MSASTCTPITILGAADPTDLLPVSHVTVTQITGDKQLQSLKSGIFRFFRSCFLKKEFQKWCSISSVNRQNLNILYIELEKFIQSFHSLVQVIVKDSQKR